MANSNQQLSKRQQTALQQFAKRGDRGRAGVFVGRKAELALIQDRLDVLMERQGEPAPGADLTTVVQGAPGVGKSALLVKIAEQWPQPSEPDWPVTIRITADSLQQPMAELLALMARSAAGQPGIVRTLVRFFSSISVSLAGLSQITVGLDPSQLANPSLTPVILLVDEIQSVLIRPMSDMARAQVNRNLRLLHTGEHGAPVFPIYAGLANSADLLRIAGLTRLAMGSERTLSRLSAGEVDEWMNRFVDGQLSSARPDSSTLESWRRAFQRDSQGWPMHGHNFLVALSEEIQAKDWCPEKVDLEAVRRRAQRLRSVYYEQRLQGDLDEQYALVSMVLEAMHAGPPPPRRQVLEWIDEALRVYPLADDETTASSTRAARPIFDTMLHAGLVQKVGRAGYGCPIPSLVGYVSAMASRPLGGLHDAVLDADPLQIGRILAQCRSDKERAQQLQVTGRRGRTPLILAAELGLISLVECLVNVDSELPPTLRSSQCQDHAGRTAWDHAAASGDEQVAARLQHFTSGFNQHPTE